MPRFPIRLANSVIAAALAVIGTSAFAGLQRTFVASTGADANPCSIAQPCRGFARAITQTNAGGEIIVQDSAGYGAVTIGQSVSIVAPTGVYAGIAVFGGNDGVTINGSDVAVALRGLTINGQGGNTGINVVAAQEVHVESVIVSNMLQSGIFINTAASLLIKDSIFRDNGGSGIGVYAGSVTVENVRSERNSGHGFYIQGGFATVDSSGFNQNAGMGVRAEGGQLTVHATMIAGNGSDGVFNNSTIVALEDCSIDENGQYGVEAHSDGVTTALTTISRSHINQNGRTSPGGGIYSSSDFADFYLTGTTLMLNNPRDYDATHCCTTTYQNNTAYVGTGLNVFSMSLF